MKIQAAEIVSDGIVITFTNQGICYFSAEALFAQRRVLKAQALLDYDPSASSLESGTPAEYEGGKCSQDSVQSAGREGSCVRCVEQ